MRRLLVVLLLVGAGTANAQPQRPGEPDPALTYSVPIDPTIDGITGPADAKVTMIVSSDYACPYCERIRDTIALLEQKYGKDLRVVERQFVVHAQTAVAYAVAACAATRQGAFTQMDAALWDHYKAKEFDDTSCLADAKTCTHVFADVAKLHLDATRFTRDMAACKQPIADAQAAWSKSFHTQAIPTMWINGRHLQGAQPIENFARLIDEELAKATAAISKGAKASTYYADAVVKRGVKTVPAGPPATTTPPVPPGGAPAIMPPPPRRPNPDAATTYAIAVLPAIDGIVGPADAKVTIVVASDYACPYCEKHRATLDALAAKYGKDLRIVHRQFIVHPTNATAFALAACAANKQGAFAKMDDALWAHYTAREWDSGECWTDPAGCKLVDATANQLKLDHTRLVRDMLACRQPIADAQAAWTASFSTNAIPATWVNGRFISGAQPVELFEHLVDEELAKATAAIKAGRAKSATYYHDAVETRGNPGPVK